MSDKKTGIKPKKSVALSGVAAGNTALCTVGRTGNDLAYRGYDILDLAENCEFEEVAHLLIHGHLPDRADLVQAQTERPAQPAGHRPGRLGVNPCIKPSHGRHAHRLLPAGYRAA